MSKILEISKKCEKKCDIFCSAEKNVRDLATLLISPGSNVSNLRLAHLKTGIGSILKRIHRSGEIKILWLRGRMIPPDRLKPFRMSKIFDNFQIPEKKFGNFCSAEAIVRDLTTLLISLGGNVSNLRLAL